MLFIYLFKNRFSCANHDCYYAAAAVAAASKLSSSQYGFLSLLLLNFSYFSFAAIAPLTVLFVVALQLPQCNYLA